MSIQFSAEDIMTATGIKSLDKLIEAQKELERFGLIRVNVRDGVNQITLLDPVTGNPLVFDGVQQ